MVLAFCQALRRCKFKFPGRQNIVESSNWGFTSLPSAVFSKLQDQGRIQRVGDHCRVVVAKGPLSEESLLLVKAKAEESQ